MPKKKKHFTLAQHKNIGLVLQTMHDRLSIISTVIHDNYPLKEKAVSQAEKTLVDLDVLRSSLENILAYEQRDNNRVNPYEIYNSVRKKDHVKHS
jgi:hypothetical protein